MTEKNIVYLYDVCGLSFDAIAARYNVSIDVIRDIVSKPKPYPLQYAPRQRYSGWINGK
jgi:transposase